LKWGFWDDWDALIHLKGGFMTLHVLPKEKPMLATKATDEQIQKLFETNGLMIGSPKLDGVRCTIQNGQAYSRSLKLIRNKYVQSELSDAVLEGLDGELIVGSPTAPDVYRTTTSAVMRENGTPSFTFWAFDNINMTTKNYRQRLNKLRARAKVWSSDFVLSIIVIPVKILEAVDLENMDQLRIYEKACLDAGFEGVILRDPSSKYKNGRATAKEGQLIKVKRFTDSEARILSMEEQMKNNNEKKINELGRSQRSSHKENKTPMGTLGALVCKDRTTGIQFSIGTGFTDKVRDQLWKSKDDLIGQIVKYKYFDIGVKDAPRHPVYLGIRDESDMS